MSDQELLRALPGFENKYFDVNGTTLHIVEGGSGYPLLLLPGWPQTWWAYSKVMSILAKYFQVIAVDVRGMGSSSKPETGYDKKNMALDIYELVQQYEFEKVYIAGHDISTTIVHSFSSQFPGITAKAIFLDTIPIDENIHRVPMLAPAGYPAGAVYPWWLAFNQVQGLPEKLLENRSRILLDYMFDILSFDKSTITEYDRLVYAASYNQNSNIRAANGWYQAFAQDAIDSKSYQKLSMPVLGIAGEGNNMLETGLQIIAGHYQWHTIPETGHFLMEERPREVAELMIRFLNE
ncbi:alpha/beta fold hydrolase [Dyadobacter sediminis]|uniref:Alpha/beta hydrolase n=1 Tax=Dyadobacter sediminis TaxID=1493691 RepID=A0A5R9KJH1_9BACT|nr:alpha/beta hydrolase [Dyadobacter sediminis]TLU96367.1 alpha/beta hydrolase [Dyadobacter sediminis]GGB81640.1 epoxide hydrolase [Dyadobacter sediminis]